MNVRSVTQHLLMLLLALSVCACSSGSATGEAVSLAITSPSSAPVVDTTDSAVTLAGHASSDMGIFKVVWANDRGGTGVANGTDAWQAPGIALELGENRITVTAEDIAGAKSSRSILVNRESGLSGSAELSWVAPTSRTDGSPLTNLAGFKIYYGRMPGIYDYQIDINNPGITTYLVENLVSGNWYFALAAYDSAGIESDRSNEVLRQIS